MNNILVVDDDINIMKVLKMRLESEGYRVITAENSNQAIQIAQECDFDLALLDLKIAKSDGIELMKDLLSFHPGLSVIILTAYGTIESAVTAMQKGAYSYLTKPFDNRTLVFQVKNAIEKVNLTKEVKRLKNIVNERLEFKNIIGNSKKMKDVLKTVTKVAETDSAVLILGESGTGKEIIARALHLVSQRKEGPFVAINCAAIPEALLEGELFGFRKGAFTGSTYSRKGYFAQADQGSLFLDEISEMPLVMQTKLLRVLEEKSFYPIGSEKLVEVNIRIIAASNKDLEKEVKEGKFRNDLYYRIHVVPIPLPSLREKKEDIPLLVEHFLAIYSKKVEKKIKGFSSEAYEKLLHYSWPGNVRELANVVECAVAMTSKNIITHDQILPSVNVEQKEMVALKEAKKDFEKTYMIELMERTHGNISNASKLSQKYRADLYKILEKHDVNPDNYRKK